MCMGMCGALGIAAIWFQVCFVAIAAGGTFFCSNAYHGSCIMVVAVLLSRAGLWLFDLCARQISQETLSEKNRGTINGQWQSLIALFSFVSSALVCIFSGKSATTTTSICSSKDQSGSKNHQK